ncbi:MAG: 2Fe-2S iron-sulfur cluster binding domain-containing protein [Magnetococcales bacterium]|nr:2Fe-2S iron-sulfur cluster binding domain-containing protein [Magnetococcales bacterium]
MSRSESWAGWRELRVVRKEYEDASRSVCSFYLVPTEGRAVTNWTPGQFLTFGVILTDETTGALRHLVRCYTLSDRPGLGYYRVSIKRAGLVSSHLHDTVAVGALLMAQAPSGQFVPDQGRSPMVLIGGGIGITPLLSMLNANFASEAPRDVWLFHGVRNSGEQVGKAHLEQLAQSQPGFHLHVCYSKPLPQDRPGKDFQHEGHVDLALVQATLVQASLATRNVHFYVCGPGAMMDALVPALKLWGVPGEQVHFESFGPSSLSGTVAEQTAPDSSSVGCRVTFDSVGKSFVWDGRARSLLEFAEDQGLEMAYGCRAGGCGACQTEIRSGAVEYFDSPDYDPEPGTCLLCVTRPKGDLVLGG